MIDANEQAVFNCRVHTWRLMAARLAQMHVPTDATPAVLLQWLAEVADPLRPAAQTLQRALQRHPWSVFAVGAGGSHELGFRVQAGSSQWWLHFATQPRSRIVRIEALPNLSSTRRP
ncbi:hypothetical protein ACG0Z6_02495 [Roseateles sp. BYS180W]|uniref:Uncharacterized protein n=1 Tax=Roseateles rivi TaxID=3299028 RepID=A0ABW7FS53_9BURK